MRFGRDVASAEPSDSVMKPRWEKMYEERDEDAKGLRD
jgi:hypothetical protein